MCNNIILLDYLLIVCVLTYTYKYIHIYAFCIINSIKKLHICIRIIY